MSYRKSVPVLFDEEMCGKGMMCQWQIYTSRPAFSDVQSLGFKDDSRRGSNKHSWHKCGGKKPGYRGKRGRAHGHPYNKHDRPDPQPPGTPSLRPVNIQGNIAPGMRAPRNTNQFLMHEKYQMMHMRSDSIGTDSGSDCEMDFADMDSYLGVLENARGALMDSPDPPLAPSARFCSRQLAKHQQFRFFSFGEVHQEESMPYFPSEHDVMQSEDFMQKDFNEFCSAIATVPPYAVA
ncbi:uncharacterized protein wu:fb55g09 [Conger conger]|uniref:uncharacterized protein wu:fb55g09 n=1 Tax=Conger conger TaxID=82655 RepID=UPI002A59D762|nr:uncharacterized protein wu:fb55g09 [Conger conger]